MSEIDDVIARVSAPATDEEIAAVRASAGLPVLSDAKRATLRMQLEKYIPDFATVVQTRASELVALPAADRELQLGAFVEMLRDLGTPDPEAAAAAALEEAAANAPDTVRPLRFHTAAELAAMTPERVEWLWRGYLARGSVTELTAKAKAGKTRLILEYIATQLAGHPFLDMRTERVAVVYLTEERPATFRNALERAGLTDCTDLYLLLRHETGEREWPAVCAEAVDFAARVSAGLLIVDTLPDWSALRGDAENDAGAALEAVRPLHLAAAAGLAVLVCRHERKGGGEIGESARGSSAFGGAVDVLMTLRRMTTPGHETRRELEGLGRFDETPGKVVIELRDGRYVVLGDTAAVEREQARAVILEHLPTQPEHAVTLAALLDACGEEVKRTTARNALDELMDTGAVAREKDAGQAGPRAYGYWQLSGKPPEALPDESASPDRLPLTVAEGPPTGSPRAGGVPNATGKPPYLRAPHSSESPQEGPSDPPTRRPREEL